MVAFGTSPDLEDFLLVGKITKPHGIQGELKVFPYSGEPADFLLYKTVLLLPSDNDGAGTLAEKYEPSPEIEVVGVRPQAKIVLVSLRGVKDRFSAEEIVGMEVWTRREYLPELGEDEFFWHDLEGLTVLTVTGMKIGVVEGLLDTGGHDLLVVKNEFGKEYLIPAKDEFLKEIDQEAGTIIISPPPGLLDLNK